MNRTVNYMVTPMVNAAHISFGFLREPLGRPL